MANPLHRRSLLWTFAASFLAVLAAAAVLQIVVMAAVVRPILDAGDRATAELRAREAADAIAAVWSADSTASVFRHLRMGDGDGVFLLLQDPEGRPLRPRRGRPDGPPRPFPPDLDDGEGPPRAPAGRGIDRWRGRAQELARAPVVVGGATWATVVAYRRGPRLGVVPRGMPWFLGASVLVAVVSAGAAGLLLFRVFVRRLRRIEYLASRVGEGDLDVRVDDPVQDEIGRLAVRLNRMTSRLAGARNALRDADTARRRLLADITHELATPLTSIRGFTETLLDGSVPLTGAERTAYLNHVLHEADRMDLLIRDLLELNRLEARAVPLERVRLDWADLVHHTVERYRPQFQARDLGLELRRPDAPVRIDADGRRMEQVIDNLLTNALRHLSSGATTTVRFEVPEPGAGDRRLVVEDDGPGFPPEDLSVVFDRFYRADPANLRGGSGLGLALVKEIIAQHGGSVRAENRVSGGACLTVTLPAPVETS